VKVKPTRLLLKVSAIASSVFLVGGYIAYRAGAFEQYLSPKQPAIPSAEQPAQPTMFYGSKSGTITPVVDPPVEPELGILWADLFSPVRIDRAGPRPAKGPGASPPQHPPTKPK
jgi:hypothetical protein